MYSTRIRGVASATINLGDYTHNLCRMDGGLDDDTFGASWDDEALDELGA